MKVLVLGGRGFIGSWIVRQLIESNRDVVLMTRTHSPDLLMHHAHITTAYGDFSDSGTLRHAMRGCDAVVHAGAYYPLFSVDRKTQLDTAIRELVTVLKTVKHAGIARFLFTSSPMVLVREPEAFQKSTYHFIKLALHNEVLRWAEHGLPAMIAIPGACFGPGDTKPTTGRVVLEIASRRLRFYLDGKMNAVDVRDVTRTYIDILERGKIGSCYQLGNWNCSLSQFSAQVARIAGVPAPRIRVPYFPINAIALAAEKLQFIARARRPLLPRSGLDQIHFGTHLDSSQTIKELGFRVRPIIDTIRDTLDYFRARGYCAAKTPEESHLPEAADSLELEKM